MDDACLLTMPGRSKAFQLVCRATTLQYAVSTLKLRDSACGWGSIHVPDVLVLQNEAGKRVEPRLVSIIYALEPPEWLQASRTLHGARCLDEVRERLLKAFRVAHLHGHNELIIGDLWACESSVEPLEPWQVKEAINDILASSLDLHGTFQKVTLMSTF